MVQPLTLMPIASGTSRVGLVDSSGAVAIICGIIHTWYILCMSGLC